MADDELELENIESENKDNEMTPLDYDISVYPADYTLEVMYQKWKNGDIEIPKFQRGYVWTIAQASRLIESFIMGLPIPPVFFYVRSSDQKYLVIDGRQRLETVFSYMEGYFGPPDERDKRRTFRLVGINEKSRLYRKSFEELDSSDQRKLKNSILRSILVKQLHPEDATSIYHIFERLNTGGTTLQDQEVRNCVYAGKLNELLIELNDHPTWRSILGKPKTDIHQKDVQLILRFMALLHSSKSYKKPMKEFLSAFMNDHKNPLTEFLEAQRNIFKKTCDKIYECLGPRPFNPRGALNPSAFDSVFTAFAKHLDNIPNDVQERFKVLRTDPVYLEAIGAATTDVDVVHRRLEKAESVLFG